jgi:hypothetical protein
MEGIPTVARGIEDEIRRSAFNGCRRVLNQTSPEELRTLLAAVRQLEATSQVSRRRPRDVAPPPPPAAAPDVVSASPPSTSAAADDILFLDQCAELTATPVKFRSEPPPHFPPQQSTTDTGGTGSVVVTASEVTEDARDAIGAYLRTWLDTVIGLSLEALTSWAMHAFCILLGLLPASSAATPKKSKTVLYSILSTFHFSNLEKRQAGPSKTLLEYAAQDRKALEAIGKKSAATTAATKGGAAAAASAPSNNKESRTKVSKNKTPSSTSTPAGKPVKVKTTKKAGMTAEPQPQDDENFDPLLSESEEESDSDHDEDHHLTVAGNVSVLRKTNRTAQGASKVTSSSSSSSRSVVDEAALTQRIAALAYLEAPITLEKLYAKLDVPLSKSEVLRVVEGMAAAQRLFLEHGIVYSA